MVYKQIHNIILIASILFTADLSSQSESYLRKQAKILSSEEMKGRGYVQNGLEKAAGYIHHQFDSLGLKPFKKDYCQKFEMSVNTFPKSPIIAIDGNGLKAGIDFHLDPISGSGNGVFEPLLFNKENIGDLPEPGKLIIPGKKIILVLDPSNIQDKDSLGLFSAFKYYHSAFLPVIVLNDNKLTWSVGKEQTKFPIVELLKSSFPENAKSIELEVRARFEEKFQAMNMMAFVKGRAQPDSFIVFTAHYDHLGMMGEEACFYGANDNASGVAYLLELARHYAKQDNKYSMVFIAFAAEEAGLLGSKHYVENPLFPLSKIKFLLNIDLMGSGDEGITVVNGTLFEKEFRWLSEINKKQDLLTKVKIRGPAANSDHYWFTQKGVPCFFIYTLGGSKAYHDVHDQYSNLTFVEFQDIFTLFTSFAARFD